jgi:hypothetical protein
MTAAISAASGIARINRRASREQRHCRCRSAVIPQLSELGIGVVQIAGASANRRSAQNPLNEQPRCYAKYALKGSALTLAALIQHLLGVGDWADENTTINAEVLAGGGSIALPEAVAKC